MPRPTRIEKDLAPIIRGFTDQIAAVVERQTQERIRKALLASLGVGGAARRKRKAQPNIRPCKVPGCGRPSKGPRFGYLCEIHRELGKREIAKLLKGGATRKAKPKALPKKAAKPAGKEKAAAAAEKKAA
jgi:hypothetical protein